MGLSIQNQGVVLFNVVFIIWNGRLLVYGEWWAAIFIGLHVSLLIFILHMDYREKENKRKWGLLRAKMRRELDPNG